MSWEYNRRVKYYETDRMGVVHHSNYLRLLEDARMDWLGDNLITYSELEKSGVIIPCVSASGEFLNYLRYDDPFKVVMRLTGFKGVKMSLPMRSSTPIQTSSATRASALIFLQRTEAISRIYPLEKNFRNYIKK